jgi:hypothetical protein
MDVFWFLVVLLLAVVGVAALPVWSDRASPWGYLPSAIALALLVVILALGWAGAITIWWPREIGY